MGRVQLGTMVLRLSAPYIDPELSHSVPPKVGNYAPKQKTD